MCWNCAYGRKNPIHIEPGNMHGWPCRGRKINGVLTPWPLLRRTGASWFFISANFRAVCSVAGFSTRLNAATQSRSDRHKETSPSRIIHGPCSVLPQEQDWHLLKPSFKKVCTQGKPARFIFFTARQLAPGVNVVAGGMAELMKRHNEGWAEVKM